MRIVSVGDFQIKEKEKKIINQVLEDGRLSEGKYVNEFEKKWANYIGVKCAVALNSGTSAIMASLKAFELKKINPIKKKTKIITSPLSYISTANAIVNSGFEPIFVDVDPDKFVITPENIEKEIDDKTSVINPIHLEGNACDMNEINKIAEKNGLYVMEDSAQAHGTLYKNRKTGSLGDISIFSFYIAHNIQAGEMGAITTDNFEIAVLIKKIKANGRMCDCPVCLRHKGLCPRINKKGLEIDCDPRFSHDIIGYNFKTTELQAALASSQIDLADEIKKKRFENVKRLNEGLKEFEHLFKFPELNRNISYLAYTLVIKDSKKIKRDELRLKLENKGIESRPLFGCIPTQQPAYRYLAEKYKDKLPNADYLGKNAFYIGCHQYLTQEDLDYIIKIFKEIL